MSSNLRRSGRLTAARMSLTITTPAAARKRRATHLPISSPGAAFQERQPKKRKLAHTIERPDGKENSDWGETFASPKDLGKMLEEVARREKELARKEASIEEREGKLKRKERVLEARQKEVCRRELEVGRMETIVREKEEDVEVREQIVGEREVAVVVKEEELNRREQGIEDGGCAGQNAAIGGPGNGRCYPRSFSFAALQAWIEGREDEQ